MKNTVHLRGGSIGEIANRQNPIHVAATEEKARDYAKRMNKILSPGEKKIMGLRYFVK